MTEQYLYHNRMKELWSRAVELYGNGQREAAKLFDEVAFIRSIGARAMDFYDAAEDYSEGGEPDWETFLLVQSARRDYFLEVQKGQLSDREIVEAEIPSRESGAAGMVWLPRLIAKAKAKLRGELPLDLMYCCGGDRKFFRNHDIHPADFLRAAWAFGDDEEGLVEWTAARSRATGAAR